MAQAKKGVKALERTRAQVEAAEKAAAAQAEKKAIKDANKMLAQIVNLHIAGYSLAEIGLAIGATPAEVESMLNEQTARYVRSQPALRTFVRNYLSSRLTDMLAVDMPIATDKKHPKVFDAQDRAIRLIDRMAKLHGADAPVQSEVKVDAKPEAVERLVAALAAGKGLAYDTDVFDDDDIVDADWTEVSADAEEAVRVSGNAVEVSDGDDSL